MLPFTPDQFIAVFARYNTAIWPAQVAMYLLGGTVITLLFRQPPQSDRIIAGVLAAMWLWTGIVYHGLFFSAINRAAYLFAVMFVVQGCMFIHAGVYRRQLQFGLRPGRVVWLDAAFVVYAAIVYPLIGLATGHRYPAMPMFGVTPCPVTIFTFGMLLWTVRPVSRWLLAIPAVWSLIGGSAAILLGVAQDWPLLFSGVLAVPILVLRERRAPSLV